MTSATTDGARPHSHEHGHSHGIVDASVVATRRGISAVNRSLVIMLGTGVLQLAVVAWSGSVALLSDSFHNVSDAFTAVPLLIAFLLVQRKPGPRFAYGYGRAEDIAGLAIVATILASAWFAGYESIRRLLDPVPMRATGAVAAAAVLGFLGNEAVARLRIRVGKEIGSAALVADGHHARVDALTSLAVLVGAVGSAAGFPIADPIVGLVIAVAILRIAWESGRAVFGRLLDEIDPHLLESIAHEASHVDGVRRVGTVRARWTGHRLQADVAILVEGENSMASANEIVVATRRRLQDRWPQLTHLSVSVGPET